MAELFTTSLINDASLEAYYRFTSGSDTTDSSSNSNTLTHVATPTNVAGKFGEAMDYDKASSEYSQADDSASLDISGDHSGSAWINIDALPSTSGNDPTIMAKWISSTGNRSYFGRLNASDLMDCRYSGTGSNQTQVQTSGAFVVSDDIGEWIHFVWTVDVSSQTFVIYKNAVPQALSGVSGTDTGVHNSATKFVVGAREIGGTPAGFMDGKLDDVALFSRILTQAEVTTLFIEGGGLLHAQMI